MKQSAIARLALILVLLVAMSIESSAALNAYLKLKRADGKMYTAKVDATGKFTFENVEPGKYDLVVGVEGTKSEEDGTIRTIEISSFSWGVSTGTSSGASVKHGRKAAKTTAPAVTSNGKAVATEDTNGDGIADKITTPLSFTPKNIYSGVLDVIFHEITVTKKVTVEGSVKTTWNIKK